MTVNVAYGAAAGILTFKRQSFQQNSAVVLNLECQAGCGSGPCSEEAALDGTCGCTTRRLAFENGWDKNVGTVTFTTFNTVDPTCAAAASTAYTLTGGTSESGGFSAAAVAVPAVLGAALVAGAAVVSYRRRRASVPKPPVTEMQNSMPSGEKKVSGLPLVHSTI